METIFKHMKHQTPACLADLEVFYIKNHAAFSATNKIEQLPETLLMGLIFEYMSENAIDFSVSDISIDNLRTEILLAMQQFEETIKHFS